VRALLAPVIIDIHMMSLMSLKMGKVFSNEGSSQGPPLCQMDPPLGLAPVFGPLLHCSTKKALVWYGIERLGSLGFPGCLHKTFSNRFGPVHHSTAHGLIHTDPSRARLTGRGEPWAGGTGASPSRSGIAMPRWVDGHVYELFTPYEAFRAP
jgi:hypothetical protein